jgi:hypothetical protein
MGDGRNSPKRRSFEYSGAAIKITLSSGCFIFTIKANEAPLSVPGRKNTGVINNSTVCQFLEQTPKRLNLLLHRRGAV